MAADSHREDVKDRAYKGSFNVAKEDNRSLLGVDIESASKITGSGTGTVFGTVTNIVKNTVGAGILVLPMAFYKGGFVLGTVVLLIVCMSCAYSFYMLGKCCEKCDRYTWDGVMEAAGVNYINNLGAWLVIILCALALTAYAVIIGVFLKAGFSTLIKDFPLNKVWYYTVIMTVCVMFPLSCLKNLESLKFTSTAGVAIVFYGTVLVIVRCIYTFGKGKDTILELYKSTASSQRTKLMEAFSWGPTGSGISLVLGIVSMLNTMSASSNCHFNAPSFYGDLKSRTTRTHRRITILAFGIIMLLNFAMSFAGYFAFGVLGQSGNYVGADKGKEEKMILSGLIPYSFLNETNIGIVSKSSWEYCGLILMMVWGLAIAFSFPLIFSALRGALYEVCTSLAPKKEDGSDEPRKRFIATLIGVFSICAVAAGLLIIAPDKGADIAFNMFGLISCTAGNAITYILPGLMWIKLNPHKTRWELKGCYFISILGSIFSVAGLVSNGNDWVRMFKE